jgi:hypothetical protein
LVRQYRIESPQEYNDGDESGVSGAFAFDAFSGLNDDQNCILKRKTSDKNAPRQANGGINLLVNKYPGFYWQVL